MHYRFEGFELDCQRGTLVGPEGPVNLRPKTYALLRLLIERAPALLPQDEIIDVIWGHSALSRNVLPQTVRELRQALGDTTTASRFIETQHRRGYRWIAPLQPIAAAGLEVDQTVDAAELPAAAAMPSQGHAEAATAPAAVRSRSSKWPVFAALVLILAAAAAWFGQHSPPARDPFAAAIMIDVAAMPADRRSELLMPLVDSVLADERLIVVKGDDGKDILPRLRLSSSTDGSAIEWVWCAAGARCPSAQGTLKATTIWADIDAMLRADAVIGASGEGLHEVIWPQDPAARAALVDAFAETERGAVDAARAAFEVALQRAPAAIAVRSALVDLLIEHGQWNQARALLRIGSSQSNVPAARRLETQMSVQALRLAGRPDAAAEAFLPWLELHPGDLPMRAAQIDAWLQLARADQALAALRQVPAAIADELPQILLLRARAARISGDVFGARQALDRAHALIDAAIEADAGWSAQKLLRAYAEESIRLVDADDWNQLSARFDDSTAAALLDAQWQAGAGAVDAALASFSAIQTRARAAGQARIAAAALYERVVLLNRRGDAQTARSLLDAALPVAESEGDARSLADLWRALATVRTALGDADGAHDALLSAAGHADFLADPIRQASIQTNLGMQLAMQGREDEAEAAIVLARALFQRSADARGELVNLINLGALESRRGRLQRARDLYREALAIAERVGDRGEMARTAYNLGLGERRLDDLRAAAQRLGQARDGFIAVGNMAAAGRAAAQIAEIELIGADTVAAQRTLDQMATQRATLPAAEGARLMLVRARVFEVQGKDRQARAALVQARLAYEQVEQTAWMRVIDLRLARIDARDGQNIARLGARIAVIGNEMERAGERTDALQAAIAGIELIGCDGQPADALAKLQALQPQLAIEHEPELLLRIDLLAARITADPHRLRALADDAQARGYLLAAAQARGLADADSRMPAAVDGDGLRHCVSTAF